MKITLVNASPKMNNSTSGALLHVLKSNFENTTDVCEIDLRRQTIAQEHKKALSESDNIVFAFPLYVDGIPGHLLSCLTELEKAKTLKPGACGIWNG